MTPRWRRQAAMMLAVSLLCEMTPPEYKAHQIAPG
jgi:hypothetical protein